MNLKLHRKVSRAAGPRYSQVRRCWINKSRSVQLSGVERIRGGPRTPYSVMLGRQMRLVLCGTVANPAMGSGADRSSEIQTRGR